MRTRVHISLQASDLDRSIAFYTRLFGAGPTKVRGDYANWRLDEPALHLSVVHVPGAARKETHEHFGVELFEGEDLARWRDRAGAAGLSLRTEEQVTCCYAVADKFWARDPDGNEWEFWVRSAEAESMQGGAMKRGAMKRGAMKGEAVSAESGESECCAPAAAPGPASEDTCCG